MVRLASTSQVAGPVSGSANRLSRIVVAGGSGLGAVLVIVALVLWAHYGSAVFFEMIASGFAACF